MEITSKLDDPINVKDVTIVVDFYDIVDDSEIQPVTELYHTCHITAPMIHVT